MGRIPQACYHVLRMKTRFRFELLQPDQKEFLLRWLDQPHIREWLHGKGLANLLKNLDAFFGGKTECLHWIGYEGLVPFSYLLTSPEGDDGITLDLFICEPSFLGRGLSVQMIREFLLTHFADKKKVFIDPEASNTRAIHVYQKAGFRKIGEFIAPWHPVPHFQMILEMKDLLSDG